jgi:hypothetical protein
VSARPAPEPSPAGTATGAAWLEARVPTDAVIDVKVRRPVGSGGPWYVWGGLIDAHGGSTPLQPLLDRPYLELPAGLLEQPLPGVETRRDRLEPGDRLRLVVVAGTSPLPADLAVRLARLARSPEALDRPLVVPGSSAQTNILLQVP